MAILHKNGNLSGRVGPVVYRTWKGATIVQTKPKKFRQTLASKESGKEFGLISSTAKVIRIAFNAAYEGYDGKMINRFNSAVSSAVRSSSLARGERDLHDGDLRGLQGFEFNTNSPLTSVMNILPESSLTADGKLKIVMQAQKIQPWKKHLEATYTLRVLVTAFNFRERWYRYLLHEDIAVDNLKIPVGERQWQLGDLPEGNSILVSFSLHATERNGLDEYKSINSNEWSPAALTAAFQLAGEEESEWKGKPVCDASEKAGFCLCRIIKGTRSCVQCLKSVLNISPREWKRLKSSLAGSRYPRWRYLRGRSGFKGPELQPKEPLYVSGQCV